MKSSSIIDAKKSVASCQSQPTIKSKLSFLEAGRSYVRGRKAILRRSNKNRLARRGNQDTLQQSHPNTTNNNNMDGNDKTKEEITLCPNKGNADDDDTNTNNLVDKWREMGSLQNKSFDTGIVTADPSLFKQCNAFAAPDSSIGESISLDPNMDRYNQRR